MVSFLNHLSKFVCISKHYYEKEITYMSAKMKSWFYKYKETYNENIYYKNSTYR